MGVFSELQSGEGLSYRELLIQKGIILEFENNIEVLPIDSEDRENINLIKKTFKNIAITPTKIDMIVQRDVMFNNSKRFICVLNRNNETGGGYQEFWGFKEFEMNSHKYKWESEKMISFSTYYSKFPMSDGKVKTVENIHRISVFSQDIDAGKSGMPIEEQLQRVYELIKSKKISVPNMILFSGTGIQLFWFIDNLVMKYNSKVYKTWVGIQKSIYKALDEAGLEPDEAVFQPIHNTRLVDTFNERAGHKLVRGYVLHTERKKLGDFINHYFADLHDVYKKNPTRQDKKEGKVIKSPKFWTMRSYAWGIIQDMNLIPQLKVMHGETLVGLKWRWRMATVVLFMAMIYYDDERLAFKEVEDWWNNLPTSEKQGTSLREIMRRCKAGTRFYKEFKKDDFDKKKYKRAGLFYKNQTFIDELQLSYEIQVQLNIIKNRIIGRKRDEKGRNQPIYNKEYERVRVRQSRREKGIKPMAEYNQIRSETVDENLTNALEYFKQGKKGKEVAELMNLTPARVSQLKKQLKEKGLL